MGRIVLLVVVAIGCGNVVPVKVDASSGGEQTQRDAPALCMDMTAITSCGATCTMCSAGTDRQVATCNGVACGLACKHNAGSCSDNSCSRDIWAFDSGMLEGAAPVVPANLPLAVRMKAGSFALAIDVTNLSEVQFRLPICLSGNINVMPKTISTKVWFDGAGTSAGQFYVQASIPTPATGHYLETRGLGGPAYETATFTANMSNLSQQATDVTFKVGTFGQPFSGTVWFDDITIQ